MCVTCVTSCIIASTLTMERRVIDPYAVLTHTDRLNIGDLINDCPRKSPVRHAVQYYKDRLSYANAARLFFTPKEANERTKIANVLALNFFELMRIGIPELSNPFDYNEIQALWVCYLYNQIQYERRNSDGSGIQNPFESVVSARSVSRETGVTSADLRGLIRNPFVFGSLQLAPKIYSVRSTNLVKTAIRELVRERGGHVFLKTGSIAENVRRIESSRQMIGLFPSVVPTKSS